MSWKVPVAEPMLSGRERALLLDVMKQGRITQGRFVEQFEATVARAVGARYAVATSSGTAAIHCALLALGIGPGDEVITTPLSCIASSNPILFQGAKPIFVDIDPKTYNMDLSLTEKAITRRTKAILAVHLFGRPLDIQRLRAIARRHRLSLIEDGCQALGAEVGGKPVGSFGDIGCFSFYANKIITTGEGGMAVTSNKALYERMRGIRNLGQDGLPFVHPWIGANYKMSNLHAAIGIAQMERFADFVRRRRQTAADFTRALEDLGGIARLPEETPGTKNVFFSYSLELTSPQIRRRLANAFQKAGIETRPFFSVIPDQASYRRLGYSARSVPHAMAAYRKGIYISCSPALRPSQKRHILKTIQRCLHD